MRMKPVLGTAIALIISGVLAAVQLESAEAVPQWGHKRATANSSSAPQMLLSILQDVSSASGYRYNAKDDQGVGLKCLKIIEDGRGTYLAVYHDDINGVRNIRLAKSSDLLDWLFVATLEQSASQATIAKLNDGGYLVSYEKETSNDGNHIAFRYYKDYGSLSRGSHSYQYDAPRTLAPTAEGTPNIYSVVLSPDIKHSTIKVGFHYYWNQDVDRQAVGILSNFNSWVSYSDTNLNTLFTTLGIIGGNIGDRDSFVYHGQRYNIHEVQLVKSDFGSWRTYLYDYSQDSLLPVAIRTSGRSSSFGNPTFTGLKLPSGKPGFVSTQFLFSEGAAAGEAGELIYFKEY